VFDNSTYSVTINEDVEIGSTVLVVHASNNEDTPIIYTLSGTNVSFFNINSTTGVISVAQSLDFEFIKQFNLIVNATVQELYETGGLGQSTASLQITVTDINDQVPSIVLTTVTEDGSYYTNYIEDGPSVLVSDNTLRVSDGDSDINIIQYAIVELLGAVDGEEEELTVSLSNSLTLDSDSSGRLVFLMGPGSHEDFQTVLKTVRWVMMVFVLFTIFILNPFNIYKSIMQSNNLLSIHLSCVSIIFP